MMNSIWLKLQSIKNNSELSGNMLHAKVKTRAELNEVVCLNTVLVNCQHNQKLQQINPS